MRKGSEGNRSEEKEVFNTVVLGIVHVQVGCLLLCPFYFIDRHHNILLETVRDQSLITGRGATIWENHGPATFFMRPPPTIKHFVSPFEGCKPPPPHHTHTLQNS